MMLSKQQYYVLLIQLKASIILSNQHHYSWTPLIYMS